MWMQSARMRPIRCRWRCSLLIASVALIAVAIGSGCNSPSADDDCIGITVLGDQVNPFRYESDVLLLIFVGSNCPVCDQFSESINSLAGELHESDIAVRLVYPASYETTQSVQKHLRRSLLPFIAILDPTRAIAKRSEVTTLPSAAIFVREGSTYQIAYHGRIDDRVISVGEYQKTPQSHDLRHALHEVFQGRDPDPNHIPAIGVPY